MISRCNSKNSQGWLLDCELQNSHRRYQNNSSTTFGLWK
uniref:Uncharacterized protein n=1 Tax=Arundo donax TaxID=35708 RepID=A0A0A9AV20_ARUDO